MKHHTDVRFIKSRPTVLPDPKIQAFKPVLSFLITHLMMFMCGSASLAHASVALKTRVFVTAELLALIVRSALWQLQVN